MEPRLRRLTTIMMGAAGKDQKGRSLPLLLLLFIGHGHGWPIPVHRALITMSQAAEAEEI